MWEHQGPRRESGSWETRFLPEKTASCFPALLKWWRCVCACGGACVCVCVQQISVEDVWVIASG